MCRDELLRYQKNLQVGVRGGACCGFTLEEKTREEASSEINRLWAQNLDAIISLRTLPSESLLCAKYINKLCHPHNGYIRRTVPSIKTWLGCL